MANGEVLLYDSMYCKLSTDAKTQIACILATDWPAIEVNFMDVQRQFGGSECGFICYCLCNSIGMLYCFNKNRIIIGLLYYA